MDYKYLVKAFPRYAGWVMEEREDADGRQWIAARGTESILLTQGDAAEDEPPRFTMGGCPDGVSLEVLERFLNEVEERGF